MSFQDTVGGFIRIWRKGRCVLQCPVCGARKSSRSRHWIDWTIKHEVHLERR